MLVRIDAREHRTGWTFLATHAQVLVCLARDPGSRLRVIGEPVGITERAAHRIVDELTDAGYISHERNGRRNRYTINTHLPIPDLVAREQNVGELLEILTPTFESKRGGRSHGNEPVIAGLLLAVGCALAGSVSVLLKQRGAVAAPTVLARHPVRSAINLFRSKWWTVGWLVALGAWLLHVGALSLASLSIVQAVISGGLVFLAIVAERFFGFQLGRRQWTGLLVTAVGLGILGLIQAPATHEHASAAALIAVECVVIAISGVLICASIRLERLRLREGILLATAAGALFGTSDIAIKHLVHPALNHVMLLVNPWTLSALIAMVVAFYASARSLQLGPAIAVIMFTSLTGNVVALLGGILVFHDPIGVGPAQIAARIAAFCLVILGAALLPGRLRAGAPTPADTPSPIPAAAITIPHRIAS